MKAAFITPQVHGHHLVVEQTNRWIAEERFPQSTIFSGPDGQGKKTLAIRIAKKLLCAGRAPSNWEACEQCPSCRCFSSDWIHHPDLAVFTSLDEPLTLNGKQLRQAEGADYAHYTEQISELCEEGLLNRAYVSEEQGSLDLFSLPPKRVFDSHSAKPFPNQEKIQKIFEQMKNNDPALSSIAHKIYSTISPVAYTGKLKVSSIREGLVFRASEGAYYGTRKVFIIDSPETMTPAAQNALLKTLEEPGSHVYIMLITAQPYSLLPTIRSRCRSIIFRNLEKSEAAAIIRTLKGCSIEEAQLRVAVSQSNVSRALMLEVSRFRELRKQLLQFLHAFPHYSLSRLNKDIDLLNDEVITDWGGTGDDRCIEILRNLLRDLLIINGNADISLLINEDCVEQLSHIAPSYDIEMTCFLLEGLNEIDRQRFVNVNMRAALEGYLINSYKYYRRSPRYSY